MPKYGFSHRLSYLFNFLLSLLTLLTFKIKHTSLLIIIPLATRIVLKIIPLYAGATIAALTYSVYACVQRHVSRSRNILFINGLLLGKSPSI